MNSKKNWSTYLVLLLLVVTISIVIGSYNWHFWGRPMSQNPADWGPLGDYFGGMLNPIITGFTLIFIVKTFSQNEKMISSSIRQMQLSQEELMASREIHQQTAQLEQENLAELKAARVLQQEAAQIERDNLEEIRISKNQAIYEQTISITLTEIQDLLNIKSIFFNSNSIIKGKSIYDAYNESSILTITDSNYSRGVIQVLKQTLGRSIDVCNEIIDDTLLINNPHKERVVRIQKSISSKLLTEVLVIIAATEIYVEGTKMDLKDHSTEINFLHDKLNTLFSHIRIASSMKHHFKKEEKAT